MGRAKRVLVPFTGEDPVDGSEILIYCPFGGLVFDCPVKVCHGQDKWILHRV